MVQLKDPIGDLLWCAQSLLCPLLVVGFTISVRGVLYQNFGLSLEFRNAVPKDLKLG